MSFKKEIQESLAVGVSIFIMLVLGSLALAVGAGLFLAVVKAVAGP